MRMGVRLNLQKTLERILIQSFQTIYARILLALFQSLLCSAVIFLFIAVLPWSGVVGVKGTALAQRLPQIFSSFLTMALPIGAFLWGPLSCGLVSFSHQMEETTKLSLLFREFRRHYAQAFRVYALYFFLVLFLIVDLLAIMSRPSLPMMVIGAVILYTLGLLFLMGLYIPGLIAFQKNNTAKVFKKALLLTMDNPVITVIIGFFLMFPVLLLAWSGLTAVGTAGLIGLVGRILLMVSLAFAVAFYGAFSHYVMERLYHAVMARYDD